MSVWSWRRTPVACVLCIVVLNSTLQLIAHATGSSNVLLPSVDGVSANVLQLPALNEEMPIPPVDAALTEEAGQEWNGARMSRKNNRSSDCTELLRQYGLCDPKLQRVPRRRRARMDEKNQPFVLLHFSKCAGTSLVSTLSYLGYMHFSIRLPPVLSVHSQCGAAISDKCCWWRERLHNLSRADNAPKILTQEPANDEGWVDDKGWPVHAVDPGFDASHDLCADLAYATVLRPPVARLHSHMCEVGVSFEQWQEPSRARRGYVAKKQLRDNYYVRSLGGPSAWGAPEGGLTHRHLLDAARTLARFDVVMTVATLARDAPVQMARVGLPNFEWPHVRDRSREDNIGRAIQDSQLQTGGRPSCDLPPTTAQLRRVVAACAWDEVLYEFARVLAARRTEAYARLGGAEDANSE